MITEIKRKLAHRQLRKSARKDNKIREMVPFQKVDKIGIIYNAPDAEEAVEQLRKQLQQNGKKAISLGYVNEKDLGSEYSPNYKTDYFCNRNTSRLNLALEADVRRFVLEEFDYLINMFTEEDLPLLSISNWSRSKFRIGPYLEKYTFCFDIMIDTKEMNLMEYGNEALKQIKNYRYG